MNRIDWKSTLQNVGRDLVEALFPPVVTCPFCQAPAKDWLCSDCDKYFSGYHQQEFCRKCGKFVSRHSRLAGLAIAGEPGVTGEICFDCSKGEAYAFWFNRGVAPYQGLSKEVLYQLKYTGRQELARAMGLLMAEVILQEARYRQVDLVVPVPIGPHKLHARGFNQGELLASQIAKVLGLPMGLVLDKPIDTPAQAKQDKYTRQQQVKGAYRVVQPEVVTGQRVLLVDDVFTTGSTVSECAQVLAEAGADLVAVITWAAGSDEDKQ